MTDERVKKWVIGLSSQVLIWSLDVVLDDSASALLFW